MLLFAGVYYVAYFALCVRLIVTAPEMDFGGD